MELHLLPFLLLLFCFLVLLKQIKKSHTPKLNLPPGPWKLPIIGSIHHLLTWLPHHAFRRLSQQHGPVMLIRLGLVDTIVVSSPEVATEILKIQDTNFSSRPQLYIHKNLFFGCTGITFSPYGDYWRQIRKISVVELLSAKRVRSFHSIFENEFSFIMLDICNSSTEGKPVNLSGMIATLMNSIIGRCAFGNKLDSANQKRLISVLKEVTKLTSGFSMVDLFPSMKYLEVLVGTKFKVQQLHRHVDEIFQGIIEERELKHAINTGPHDEKFENILDVLLRIRRQVEPEIPLSDDNLKVLILDIFIGGSDSSSTLVVWAMSELMKNPQMMKKAKEEIRRVLKVKTDTGEREFAELHYLKLVIKETLRLHPPGPLMSKMCVDTCKVVGYDIPGGTRVYVNAWAMGRDPQYWEDAEEFKPERFINNPINFKGENFEYLPFGAGRRMCPGVSFANDVAEFTLAHLLLHFDWELPNGMATEELDMTETFGVIADKKIDLYLLATMCSPTMVENDQGTLIVM